MDLFGSTPGIRRQPAAEVLGRFLRSLGVPQGEIPPDEIEAAALLRTVTSGRRLLLVLDNAADREQIALLMPSSPACAVLVTGRQPLPTVDADDRLRVDRLPDPDALALFTLLIGGRELDPEAAQSIVAYAEAIRCADEAIASARETSDLQSECEALLIRSEAALRDGNYAPAETDATSALSVADTHGYRYVAAAALRQRARIYAAAGRSAEAERVKLLAAEAYARLTGANYDPLIELLLSGSSRHGHGAL